MNINYFRAIGDVSAKNSAMTRGCPNFNDGAFSPSSVTVGCTTRWMPSPLKPQYMGRHAQSKVDPIVKTIFRVQ